MSCLQSPLRYLTVTVLIGSLEVRYSLRMGIGGIGVDLAFMIFHNLCMLY